MQCSTLLLSPTTATAVTKGMSDIPVGIWVMLHQRWCCGTATVVLFDSGIARLQTGTYGSSTCGLFCSHTLSSVCKPTVG